ncbi:MAG: hypothetical protein JWO87_549 [Phycisphaerales bacterium]|nr:hypothetical protein [Phycisphaerales bacterium]
MRDPTLNDADDAPRDAAGAAEWARWEQTFRDARPVLPEAAMARIEARMRNEVNLHIARPHPRRRWMLGLGGMIVAASGVAFWWIVHTPHRTPAPPVGPPMPGPAVTTVVDRYPLDVVVGPQLAAPNQPVLPIERYGRLIHGPGGAPTAQVDQGTTPIPASAGLLRAAQRLYEQMPTYEHAIGLIELRHAAGVVAPLPLSVSGKVEDFHRVACWRMLPPPEQQIPVFRDQLHRLKASDAEGFWPSIFLYFVPPSAADPDPVLTGTNEIGPPGEFPSRLGDYERYEMLVELGLNEAQAWLTMMTSRSYEPLAALEVLDGRFTARADALRAQGRAADAQRITRRRDLLREGYLSASHDLVERLFALRLLGRTAEAEALLAQAKKIKYLNDPQDMAILLARLGPVEVSSQLMRPMLASEVNFIQKAPRFDVAGPSQGAAASVFATSKAVHEGVTTYAGGGGIHAGPLHITCKGQITAFRTGGSGILLSATGNANLKGVVGLIGATADEITFDTETGTTKLAGHVHLDLWEKAVDLKSCTITRTGEIRDEVSTTPSQ